MLIGGFQKSSLIDYPGKICAIIFTQGCNFRCPYCHNSDLVKSELFNEPIPEKEILYFLEKRKGMLDAVEFTGGEPTVQKDLLQFMEKIKKMGFLVKLDSNGTHPEVIKKAIKNKLVDYLAMDIKAPLEKYSQVVGVETKTGNIQESINLIMSSGIDYEFRTTVVRSLLSKEDILQIGKLIKGAKNYYLQKFVPEKTLDPNFLKEETYSDEELGEIKSLLEKDIDQVIIRE